MKKAATKSQIGSKFNFAGQLIYSVNERGIKFV